MTDSITILRPDDWHLHLRDGAALAVTVPATATSFARAIVMPNLVPPVTTVKSADAYRARILAEVPAGIEFEPLMTLYLTDETSAEELQRAAESDFVHAVKLYPAGATTNSDSGVTSMDRVVRALEVMQELDIPLLIHGEVTDPDIDIFDREKIFIDRHLRAMVENFPNLRIVLEHITTRDAADFVREAPAHVAATITAHHLRFERNAMLAGGFRPHFYCLPILKRSTHRAALIEAATSGDPKFFLGTDSAPHVTSRKESACGCAGCYTASEALGMYAEVFDEAGKLERLEGFASIHGADFYRLPQNNEQVTLERRAREVPTSIAYCDDTLKPLLAGQTLEWSMH